MAGESKFKIKKCSLLPNDGSSLDEEYNIAIRSGMHCVHSWFNSRGIDGTARASAYLYNNESDVLSFTSAIEEMLTKNG